MPTNIHPPQILNEQARVGVILLCDHASNHIPAGYENLGLDDEYLDEHNAWDIGMAEITRRIAKMMKVPAVLAPVSRLVIDCNRGPDDPTLVPRVSDGINIPVNNDMGAAQIAARRKTYWEPFHQAADAIVKAHLDDGIVPLVIGMHSFTPSMDGEDRPWGISFLWNKDPRLAQAMIGWMERETDLVVGDNVPYSGRELYYTMQTHGADHGCPQTTLEVRQDLVLGKGMLDQWAALIADAIDECLERPELREIKHY